MLAQHVPGPFDHCGRKPRQLRYFDSITLAGRARFDAVQKDNAAGRFFHAYAQVPHSRQLLGQHRQFMIVRGEQRPRTGLGMKVLDRRPGQREPVEGGRSAAHLVEQDERPIRRRIQNRRRFGHLHHEGRASARHVVAGPDARINPVHQAKAQALSRHKAAHLGQQNQHRRLAQISALAAHVRTSYKQKTRPLARPIRPRRAQVEVVRDKPSLARLFHPLLDHRMAPGNRLDHRLFHKLRPHIAPPRRQVREVGQQVRLGHGGRRALDPPGGLQHGTAQLRKNPLLNLDRPLVRGQNLALVFLQLRRRKPLGVDQRLLTLVIGRRQRLVGLGNLNVIAENRVITHLQRVNSCPLPLPLLDSRNLPPPGGGNRPQLVQLRVHARGNRSAVGHGQRRLHDQRSLNPRGHVFERVQLFRQLPPPGCPHRFEGRPQSRQAAQARPEGAHVARSRRIQGKPRQQPLQVQKPGKGPANLLAPHQIADGLADGLVAAFQSFRIHQRPQNRRPQEALAHRRLAGVQGVEERRPAVLPRTLKERLY